MLIEPGNETFLDSQNVESDPENGLQPLMIGQLLNAVPVVTVTREGEITKFILDGRPIRKCLVVANVYNTNKGRRGINYGLDDSTGRIQATTQTFDDILKFKTFAYARVIGTLSRWNDVNRLDVIHICPVMEFHEVYHHILSAIWEVRETFPEHLKSMKVTPKRLPSPSPVDDLIHPMSQATVSLPEPIQPERSSTPESSPVPVPIPVPVPDQPNPEPELPANVKSGDIETALNPQESLALRRRIWRYICKQQQKYVSGEPFDGIVIDDIVRAMQKKFPSVKQGDFINAIEDLVTQDKIYNTINDTHFGAHEKEPKHGEPVLPE